MKQQNTNLTTQEMNPYPFPLPAFSPAFIPIILIIGGSHSCLVTLTSLAPQQSREVRHLYVEAFRAKGVVSEQTMFRSGLFCGS